MVYRFEVSAQNSHGEATAEPQLVEIPVYLDQDDDGLPDVSDSDIDGDGVDDYRDLWPRDPNEWEDTDGDGIGNNADNDDDGDGVADGDDIQPLDFLCSIASDTDGEVCLQRVMLRNANAGSWAVKRGPGYVNFSWGDSGDPWGFFLAEGGTLYYWGKGYANVYRWDANTGHFMASAQLDYQRFSEGFFIADGRFALAPSQHTAYVFYDTLRGTQGLTRIGLEGEFEESTYLDGAQVTALGYENIHSLDMADQTASALVVKSLRSGNRDYVALDLDGEVLARHTSEVPEAYADEEEDIVLRPGHLAPFCTWGVHFDDATGRFVDGGSGDPARDPCTNTQQDTGEWPLVSADGQLALTSAGIIDRNQNVLMDVPDMSPANSVWQGQTLYHLNEADSRIARISSTGEGLGHMAIPEGYVHNLLSAGEHVVYVGISVEDTHVLMLRYEDN